MNSVQAWADGHGYDYRWEGDEFLARVPDWYEAKVSDRKPIVADLARLLWMQEVCGESVDAVVWLDADTLIFEPGGLSIIPGDWSDTCQFGVEYWLQADDRGRRKIYRNVHNAYCAFKPESHMLPFLIEAVMRLVRRADAQHIPPQFVGPKLLTSLYNLLQFDVDERLGAISPLFAQDILKGSVGSGDILAANLCASLELEMNHTELIAKLTASRQGIQRPSV